MAIDNDKLMDFLHRFVGDLGAALAAGNVVIGNRLGLFAALATGPATPAELAAAHGHRPAVRHRVAARPGVRRLRDQDRVRRRGDLLADRGAGASAWPTRTTPIFAPGGFLFALGALKGEERVAEAIRTGTGIGWHEGDEDMLVGCEQFFRPGYHANLTTSWIPALSGVERKLQDGARVADIGCGLGASSVIMAQAYPASRIAGSDYDGGSIERGPQARGRRRRRRPGHLRGGQRPDLRRHRLRPGHLVRLPARHGRPAVGRPARPRGAGPGRLLDDRRAVRRRTTRRTTSTRSAGCTTTSRPWSACRTRSRSPAATRSARRRGRRRSAASSPTPASPGSPGSRRPRSTSSTRPVRSRSEAAVPGAGVPGARDRREEGPRMRAVEPSKSGTVERDGVRVAYEVFGDGERTVVFVPIDADHRVPRLEGAGALAVPPGAGDHDRPAGQRPVRPAGRPGGVRPAARRRPTRSR